MEGMENVQEQVQDTAPEQQSEESDFSSLIALKKDASSEPQQETRPENRTTWT